VYIGRRATTTLPEKLIMIAIKPQTIRSPSGEELVVLSRAEFDALTSAAAEALEDADDVAVFDERMAALNSGLDAPLPVEVSAAMLRGESLLRALRSWKGVDTAGGRGAYKARARLRQRSGDQSQGGFGRDAEGVGKGAGGGSEVARC
jgi:hypothetical protein